MCGIIGIIGKSNIQKPLVDGLKRLEYRGYDSAGVATVMRGHIECRRAQGKLSALEYELSHRPIYGTTGIGHTRWATHGRPNITNAHPHRTDKVAVVHNGIIENFMHLKHELEREGALFSSETDSEVIPHLITYYLKRGHSPRAAAMMAIKRLEGTFAIVVMFADNEQFLLASRCGSPLLIGYGEGEMYVGSDAMALKPLASHITYLEDGDLAELYSNDVVIYNTHGERVDRSINTVKPSDTPHNLKGDYRHFMLKEIHEQPEVIMNTLCAYYNPLSGMAGFALPSLNLEAISHLNIIACGTSYYAGMVAKYWLEMVAQLPVSVDIASEYRYRSPVALTGSVALLISQSGETADTLAALKLCRTQGQHIISLVNVMESSMAQASDTVFKMLAGPEIGVAATKSFSSQLLVLACFAIALAHKKHVLARDTHSSLCSALSALPAQIREMLASQQQSIQAIAKEIASAQSVLYIGRGVSYPIAMEGALKLKELTYIHAEGIAAGELKHGPIALVDEQVPVIVIAPSDTLFGKTASNLQEVSARGGKIILVSDADGIKKIGHLAAHTVELPAVHPFVTPILYSIPIQMLAYHTALIKGTDVDQPRNLAKSVTVE